MSCSHEAHDHDHHDQEHDGHSHDVPLESSPLDSLYTQIDLPNVMALNAEGGGEAGRKVIKWVTTQYPTDMCWLNAKELGYERRWHDRTHCYLIIAVKEMFTFRAQWLESEIDDELIIKSMCHQLLACSWNWYFTQSPSHLQSLSDLSLSSRDLVAILQARCTLWISSPSSFPPANKRV